MGLYCEETMRSILPPNFWKPTPLVGLHLIAAVSRGSSFSVFHASEKGFVADRTSEGHSAIPSLILTANDAIRQRLPAPQPNRDPPVGGWPRRMPPEDSVGPAPAPDSDPQRQEQRRFR